MNDEHQNFDESPDRRAALLAEARDRLASQAVALTAHFGARDAMRLLLDNALGLALHALPRADVSAFLRETAAGVDALVPPRVN